MAHEGEQLRLTVGERTDIRQPASVWCATNEVRGYGLGEPQSKEREPPAANPKPPEPEGRDSGLTPALGADQETRGGRNTLSGSWSIRIP